MTTTSTIKIMLLGSAATLALMTQAQALEAEAFLDRVEAVYKHIGYTFEFGEGTVSGDSVTVNGVNVGMQGMEGMDFDTEIVFTGIREEADGTYYVDSVTIPDVDTDFTPEEDGPTGHLTIADIEATGLYLPAGDTLPGNAALQLAESLSTGRLEVTRDGEPFFSYDAAEAVSTFQPAQGPDLTDLTSRFAITGMTADLSSAEEDDPNAAAVIEALGLTNISGDITQSMSWSLGDGHLIIDEFLFDFADVGALDLTADMTGLTADLIGQFYAMQAQMALGTEMTEEQSQAQAMQSLALMQGVNVVGATIRYDDASLAGKLLDYFAEQNGSDRATFVEGLKASLPALVGQTGIPALTDLVVPPASEFLDDPQSLEIRVAPPSPTSVLVLAAAAANPAGLITALGLALEANTANE